MTTPPIALTAAGVPLRTKPSNYPEPFASMMQGRTMQLLGEPFGMKHFDVNRTALIPGGVSALHHAHSLQDEMIYGLQGHPTLFVSEAQTELQPGMCAGFAASGPAHHLKNNTQEDVVILEIDLHVATGEDGTRYAAHNNGEPYR